MYVPSHLPGIATSSRREKFSIFQSAAVPPPAITHFACRVSIFSHGEGNWWLAEQRRSHVVFIEFLHGPNTIRFSLPVMSLQVISATSSAPSVNALWYVGLLVLRMRPQSESNVLAKYAFDTVAWRQAAFKIVYGRWLINGSLQTITQVFRFLQVCKCRCSRGRAALID